MFDGTASMPEVDPAGAQGLLERGAFLLDVREHDEWQVGRAPGATHIPLGELAARLSEVPEDRTVIVVCRMGGRSAAATEALMRIGIDACNLAGGMQAWAASGRPVVADGGHVGGIA